MVSRRIFTNNGLVTTEYIIVATRKILNIFEKSSPFYKSFLITLRLTSYSARYKEIIYATKILIKKTCTNTNSISIKICKFGHFYLTKWRYY